MSDAARVETAWQRIEGWLAEHLQEGLSNLRPPASSESLTDLERQLGRELPEGLRASLTRHDGEQNNWPPNATSDGQWLLPAAEIASHWTLQRDLASQLQGSDDTPDQWKAQIEDGVIAVDGPVKPLLGSPSWIPFSEMNGDVFRYLDFDPPDGGVPGQVIEVDPESCTHRVVSTSLADFLEVYADDLEAGHYSVEDDVIERSDAEGVDPTRWGVPDYLRDVEYETFPAADSDDPHVEGPDPSTLAPGEETTLVGEMGLLAGSSRRTFFTLLTGTGRRYEITAHSDLTRGYGAIAVEQGARVRVRRQAAGLVRGLLQLLGLRPVKLVALEYQMLRNRR